MSFLGGMLSSPAMAEKMQGVIIEWWTGATAYQRKELAQKVAKATAGTGVAVEMVTYLFGAWALEEFGANATREIPGYAEEIATQAARVATLGDPPNGQ